MSRPLDIEISDLAKAQIRTAENWWRLNRPKAPNAIREELERTASIVSLQPEAGTRALNISLSGVRRLHLARVRYYKTRDPKLDLDVAISDGAAPHTFTL